jgi:E3 SUMO-protein ligase PIAS1
LTLIPFIRCHSARTRSHPVQTIRHNIKQNTVDKLKQILSGFNSECGTNFSKSGKKQEIIDRIVRTLDIWRSTTMTEKWIKAKAVVTQVRYSGM